MKLDNVEAVYPLTPLQQGILFHSLYLSATSAYFEQVSGTLCGPLQTNAFARAWQIVTDRHSALRTAFLFKGVIEPLAIVGKQVRFPFHILDWRNSPPNEIPELLQAFLRADRDRGFDLAKGPLMRLALIRTEDETYRFVWSHHHIVIDGWSWRLLLSEVFHIYAMIVKGRKATLPTVRPYRDFIAWLADRNHTGAEVYWRQLLAGFASPTRLQVDQRSGSPFVHADDEVSHLWTVEQRLTTQLSAVARDHRLTMNTLMQGAFGLLLSRNSGQRDVVFGAVVSGRPPELEGAESIVGLFINTLPVRVRAQQEQTLAAWLHDIQEEQVNAWQYQYTPLARIKSWISFPENEFLVQYLLSFQNYPPLTALQMPAGLGLRDVVWTGPTNYPLVVRASYDSELTISLTYHGSRFAHSTILQFAHELETILRVFSCESDERLGSALQRQLLQDGPSQGAPRAAKDLFAFECTSHNGET